MKNFQIIRALSSGSAVTNISKESSAMFIAGGTNLVDLMKKNVTAPDKLIDINGLDLKKIEFLKGKVSIGALAKNSQVAEDSSIKEKHPLLALALAAGASQQIRHMATVGGNMLQKTRCSYYYNNDMPCNKEIQKVAAVRLAVPTECTLFLVLQKAVLRFTQVICAWLWRL